MNSAQCVCSIRQSLSPSPLTLATTRFPFVLAQSPKFPLFLFCLLLTLLQGGYRPGGLETQVRMLALPLAHYTTLRRASPVFLFPLAE